MRIRATITIAILGALSAAAIGYGAASASIPSSTAAQQRHQSAAPQAAVARPTGPGSLYTPVPNCRVGNTAAAGGKIPNGGSRDFQVAGTSGFAAQGGAAGGCRVPAYATAVSARLTAFSATANGAFTAYPTGGPGGPGTLYYAKGVNVTTGATLQLGSAGKITVKNTSGPAYTAIDVNGYYTPQIHAVLGGLGGIVSGSSLVLSNTKVATGYYRVEIGRDLVGCTAIASVDSNNAWYATAQIEDGYVYAGTFNPAGEYQDLYWTLSVVC